MATIKPNFKINVLYIYADINITITIECVAGLHQMHNYIKQGNQLHSVCVRSFLFMRIYAMFTRATIFLLLYFRKRKKINYTSNLCYAVLCSVRKCKNEHTHTQDKRHCTFTMPLHNRYACCTEYIRSERTCVKNKNKNQHNDTF